MISQDNNTDTELTVARYRLSEQPSLHSAPALALDTARARVPWHWPAATGCSVLATAAMVAHRLSTLRAVAHR